MGSVTVCYGCYKRIDPVWVLDKAARERLLAEGCTYERLVMLNRTKTLEARQPVPSEGGCKDSHVCALSARGQTALYRELVLGSQGGQLVS